MKNLLYSIFILIALISCNSHEEAKGNVRDSIYVRGLGTLSMNKFLKAKDTLRYVSKETIWVTKEYYKWNYEYPDTIIVRTQDPSGYLKEVKAVRQGLLKDSTGKYYSPAYLTGPYGYGDVYDVNGKYIGNCYNLDI